jgi:thioredoxin-related protein
MKRFGWCIVTILFSLASGISVCSADSGGHIVWRGDYEKAREYAVSTSRALMVVLTKQDCPECVSLVRRIASSPEYREALQNSMVAVIVDSDAVSYPVELYYTTVYPALFIVESTTEIFLTPPCRGEECLALPPLPERKKNKR